LNLEAETLQDAAKNKLKILNKDFRPSASTPSRKGGEQWHQDYIAIQSVEALPKQENGANILKLLMIFGDASSKTKRHQSVTGNKRSVTETKNKKLKEKKT